MTSTSRTPRPPDLEAACNELLSLRDWQRFAHSALLLTPGLHFGHGSASPAAEALQLLSWITRMPPSGVLDHLDATLTRTERAALAERLGERLRGLRPMAYILGEAWFGGVRFLCDERALVPRSLILEALDGPLEQALAEAGPACLAALEGDKANILDLCCGGGSIAITAALRFHGARLTAADLSSEALALARSNVREHGLEDRISLRQGDLFAALVAPGKTVRKRHDLILCNPPYVNAGSMRQLPAEFRAEPEMALAAGHDGMDLIRRILREAPAHLKPQGWLLLEIGHEAPHFEAAFPWLSYSWLEVTAGPQMLVLVSCAELQDMQAMEGA